MKIVDVKLGHSATGFRLHIHGPRYRISLCRKFLFGSTDSKFLLSTDPEPLSVRLPDGTTRWGPQTEIKVDGVKVCATCLRRLRRNNR